MLMYIGIITLLPNMFNIFIEHGQIKKAIKNKHVSINIWNPRNFTKDKYRKVDDYPYGGGPGMIMSIKPIYNAINKAKQTLGYDTKVIYLSPQGKKINHTQIYNLIKKNKKIIILCGRYKGIDERIIQNQVDMELSIGDYILSGGELPAMVLIESLIRLIPGIITKQSSIESDSFYNGILDAPYYTRPYNFKGLKVPKILLTGNHKLIYLWRLKQALGRTWLKRPDLFNNLLLNNEQNKLISEFKNEFLTKLISIKKHE